ncbi:hypothetical protein ACO0K9_00710 [Undibacterium sp. Ji50W]|uniref:hypothetical protein n=1 Tax=Undibacterium sp. Ji50W TaxID=3413041 RepID=UPI003BF3C963
MEQHNNSHNKPLLRPMLMIVLWPAFLMACAATGLFFSLVDPMELIVLDHRLQMHASGVYTVGFFAFWLLGILSSGLTALLVQKAH